MSKIESFVLESINNGLNELADSIDTIFAVVGDDKLRIDSDGVLRYGNSDSPKHMNITGKLAVGVNSIPNDVSIITEGAVKFQGKKFEVGDQQPTIGNYNKGDIVWCDSPEQTKFIGWVCVREGTPGLWKPFGYLAE